MSASYTDLWANEANYQRTGVLGSKVPIVIIKPVSGTTSCQQASGVGLSVPRLH